MTKREALDSFHVPEKRVRLSEVNADLRLAGIVNTELVRGRGYFYFSAIDGSKPWPMEHAHTTSVMSAHLGSGNLDRSAWLTEAWKMIADSDARKPEPVEYTKDGAIKITTSAGTTEIRRVK